MTKGETPEHTEKVQSKDESREAGTGQALSVPSLLPTCFRPNKTMQVKHYTVRVLYWFPCRHGLEYLLKKTVRGSKVIMISLRERCFEVIKSCHLFPMSGLWRSVECTSISCKVCLELVQQNHCNRLCHADYWPNHSRAQLQVWNVGYFYSYRGSLGVISTSEDGSYQNVVLWPIPRSSKARNFDDWPFVHQWEHNSSTRLHLSKPPLWKNITVRRK